MIRIFAAAALFAGLAACNTVNGIGQDLSVGGAVISDVANHSRPSRPVYNPYYQ